MQIVPCRDAISVSKGQRPLYPQQVPAGVHKTYLQHKQRSVCVRGSMRPLTEGEKIQTHVNSSLRYSHGKDAQEKKVVVLRNIFEEVSQSVP